MSQLTINQKAAEFDRNNPKIWQLFVKEAADRVAKGFKHYSVNAVFERIRWHNDVPTKDGHSSFKLSNNYRAYYARKFNEAFPTVGNGEFFRTREQAETSK